MIFTVRSRAQKEAMAPPIECPVTIMRISPYSSLVLWTALIIPGRIVVLW